MCTYNFVLRPKNDFDQDDKGLFPAEEQDSEDDVIVLIGGYYVPNDTVSTVHKRCCQTLLLFASLGQDTVETLRLDAPEGQEQSCASLPYESDYVIAFSDPKGRPIACGGRGSPVRNSTLGYFLPIKNSG